MKIIGLKQECSDFVSKYSRFWFCPFVMESTDQNKKARLVDKAQWFVDLLFAFIVPSIFDKRSEFWMLTENIGDLDDFTDL